MITLRDVARRAPASSYAIAGHIDTLALCFRHARVEPGYGPSTSFTSSAGTRMDGLIPEAYAPFAQRIFASLTQEPAAVTIASEVTEVVWRAANDASGQLRFPAGPDAVGRAR